MINGFPIWTVLLICVGVFLASFMDAIAGGGGIISVPTYLLALTGAPIYLVLGTNKLSSAIGTVFSTARFIKNRCVAWKLAIPSAVLAIVGSMGGTWLQHHTPDVILKLMLLIVLPVIALLTLRKRSWPEGAEPLPFAKQAAIVWISALILGAYDGYYGPDSPSNSLELFVSFIIKRLFGHFRMLH